MDNKIIDWFSIALQMRTKEIDLFWQRNNYFLVLNTAIAAGIVSSNKFATIIASFGIIISILWFQASLGSRFWNARWSQRLRDLEEEIQDSKNLFNRDKEIAISDVRRYFQRDADQSIFGKFIRRQVLKGHSTTLSMIKLPLVFLMLYIILLLYSIFN